MADDVLKQFVVSLGWKVDKDGERRVTETITSITRQAGVLAAALTAAAAAAAAAVAKIAEQFDNLYFTSQRTGATVQNIKGLAYAFGQVGGSGAQAVSAIESFSRSMRTNPGIKQFVRDLGVATEAGGKARDTVDVLTDAVEAIQKKNPYYVGSQMAALLGIDEQTFNTLSRHTKEVREFRAEYDRTARMVGLNNEAAAAASNKFMAALRGLTAAAQAVAEKILTDLSPVLTGYLESIRAWIEKNPDKIEKAIRAIIDAGLALLRAFGDIVTALAPVAEGFQKIAESLTGKEGLEAAMTAFATFLVGTWVVRILGAFSAIGVGWMGLLATLGIGSLATELYKGSQTGKALAHGGVPDAGLSGGLPGVGDQGGGTGGEGAWARTKRLWERGKSLLGLSSGGGGSSASTGESTGAGAANPEAAKALGDAIASVEAGRDGYDTVLGNGAYGRPDKPLTQMTLTEARAFGRQVRGRHGSSSALGRYQIVNTTRDLAQRALGLSDDTVYTPEVQDRMMRWIARNQGLGAWEGLKINGRAMQRAREAVDAGGMKDAPPGAAAMPEISTPRPSADMSKLSTPIPPVNIPRQITREEFNDRFGGVGPMGANTNNTSTDNRSVKIEHKTDIHMNGLADPATNADRVKGTLERGNELSLRNAQSAIR